VAVAAVDAKSSTNGIRSDRVLVVAGGDPLAGIAHLAAVGEDSIVIEETEGLPVEDARSVGEDLTESEGPSVAVVGRLVGEILAGAAVSARCYWCREEGLPTR